MGGDQIWWLLPDIALCFNPRPRMGGDKFSVRGSADFRCFNPRPRMGGDISRVEDELMSFVSIHAPAWGATYVHVVFCVHDVFQSTPPHGGRLYFPTKINSNTVFQSTPPHGGRPYAQLLFAEIDAFQSTPPHGGRPSLY